VKTLRTFNAHTHTKQGTIRGDLCIDVGRNICHGSDSVEAAKKEIALWFPEGVSQHLDCSEKWVYEKKQEDVVFLGMGNPLLDISAVVPEKELQKWGAKLGDAMLADAQKHTPMYADLVKNYDVEYIAGGATQNSIRVAATLLKSTSVNCGYIGCIGKDKFGEQLKKSAAEAGVQALYLEDEKTPTGMFFFLPTYPHTTKLIQQQQQQQEHARF